VEEKGSGRKLKKIRVVEFFQEKKWNEGKGSGRKVLLKFLLLTFLPNWKEVKRKERDYIKIFIFLSFSSNSGTRN